ncbi:MAG: molybdopterin molybdotransferase MoeA [Actinobacteria bacterium]|nr:molybdopterin molybdotransferase MoeA [Actinomycetota bacterium]
MKKEIGFAEALGLTLSSITPLGSEELPLEHLTGRVLAGDIISRVDSPSIDASLKDGYALLSKDLQGARADNPVALHLLGSVSAGASTALRATSGRAIRVTTGAPLPQGADAVLAEEFATVSGHTLLCHNTAEPGRNILPRGTDIRRGQTVARTFEHVTPSLVGLLATAGIDRAPVFTNPVVCVIATGDEVVAPGRPLPEGMLYASNITEICAWLSTYRISSRVCFAGDTKEALRSTIEQNVDHVDAFISSGGIWGSERDLILQVLESRSWKNVYHRVRMGPGKAITFGFLEGKPFFCLPGGPPSNEMAFLQIALPGVLRMRGHTGSTFPMVTARLAATVRGVGHWTQFIHAKIERTDGRLTVVPLQQKSRLQSMAGKDALICIPEGYEMLEQGALVDVQLLDSRVLHTS